MFNTHVSVYNIEVHGEHVYQVGQLGLLVHNTYADDLAKNAADLVAPKGGLPRIGTPKAGTTEVAIDSLTHTHPVPRPGKSIADTIDQLKSGFDVSQPIPVLKMGDGKMILAGGNHRLEAMRQLVEKTIPCRVVDWSSLSQRMKDFYRTNFPDVFGGY